MGVDFGVLIFDFAVCNDFYQAGQESTEGPNYYIDYISSATASLPRFCLSASPVSYSTISQAVHKALQAEVPF